MDGQPNSLLSFEEPLDAVLEDNTDPTRASLSIAQRCFREYQEAGISSQLDKAITILFEASDAVVGNAPYKTKVLSNLGVYLKARYLNTKSLPDLEESIRVTRSAGKIAKRIHQKGGMNPEDDPDRAKIMHNLGLALEYRYEEGGASQDIRTAINLMRTALSITTSASMRAKYSIRLGALLYKSFRSSLRMTELDDAIRVTHIASTLTPEDVNKVQALGFLAEYLYARYSFRQVETDLSEAIRITRTAVQIVMEDNVKRSAYLYRLGCWLSIRYSLNESEPDLQDSIQYLQAAVDITPDDHIIKALRLTELAKQYNSRYMRHHALSDIQKATDILWAAIGKPGPVGGAISESHIGTLRELSGYTLSKYQHSDAIPDLNELIQVIRLQIDATPPDDTDRAIHIASHAAYLRARYGRNGERSDLEEAIRLTQVAIDGSIDDKFTEARFSKQLRILRRDISLGVGMTSGLHEAAIQITRPAVLSTTLEGASIELELLDTFMIHLVDLCEIIETISFSKRVIGVMRSASNMTPAHHPARITISKHLADSLVYIFEQTMEVDFLKEAIRVLKESLETAPDGHHYVEAMLCTLRCCLDDKYKESQELADLEDLIDTLKSTLHMDADNYKAQSTALYVLGYSMGNLFTVTQALDSLDDAIRYLRKAIEITPEQDDRKSFRICLGDLLGTRYRETGAISDIEEAIRLTRSAADEATSKLKRAPILNSLGHLLQARFKRTGTIADIYEAVQISQEVVNGLPGTLTRPVYLNGLCLHLCDLFGRTGHIVHLEEAIRVQRAAVTKLTQDDNERSRHLYTLGNSLYLRYLEVEVESDLEEAINLLQEALDIISEDSPYWATYMSKKSLYFDTRYERTGEITDLDEATRVAYAALAAAPKGHSGRAVVLEHLSNRLSLLYTLTGVVDELERAIEFAKEALEIASDGPEHAQALNCLAVHLSERHKGIGELADIDEAVHLTRMAVDVSPKAEDKVRYRKCIALYLHDKYKKTRQLVNLDEAVQAAEEAVDWTPNDHRYYAEAMGTLATILEERYSRTKATSDIQRAIQFHHSALSQANAQVRTRIEGGTDAVRCCALISDWQQAYEIILLVISLVPTLISRSYKNSDKQHVLSWAVGIASDAAATALNAAKGPYAAINLLEQSRGLLANSLEEMRADILDLREKHPSLAEEFIRLQGELNLQASRDKALHDSDGNQPLSFQVQTSQPYQTDKAFDQLLADIRGRPGFATFLLPPTQEEMMQAASKGGPIVVINVSKYRSDAILIQEDLIQALPLPGLRSSDVDHKSASSNLGAPHILAWLWDVIAKPVLDALACTSCPSEGSWRRLWWVPIGPLSRFPLHGAGRHFQNTGEAVIDRVMSSYSSSIKAIIRGRQRPLLSELAPAVQPQALLVAVRHTPGYSTLRFAKAEVEVLRGICKSMPVDIVEPGHFRDDIVALLPECSIFHFAGHGYTHRADPSQSHLLAYDGRITVASLLEMDLKKSAPFLAYLSACGTGRVRDDDFLDESIHLISAFQLAGFRHVIGTLWEVNDKICTEMARLTYEGIRDGGMTDNSVCLGLHNASRTLRNTWVKQELEDNHNKERNCGSVALNVLNIVVGTDGGMGEGESRLPRDIVPDEDDDEEGKHPAFWIPYVHFGV